MGIFDWLGPLNAGNKRRGWDALPVATEQKASWTLSDSGAALTVRTLVHGPGATELLAGQRGSDGNSAVFACLQAISEAYVEAPLVVYRQISPKEREPLFDSPLQAFLDFPNPELDLLEILAWVQWAKHVDGNAYLRKLRAGNEVTGNVVELWPISPTRIKPMTDKGSGQLISFYRYYDRPGHVEDIPRENMVHFRMGIDDQDHRLGCAPLKRLLREVSSDDQTTRYADRLLANLAINGLSLEFDKDREPITQDDADIMKQRIQSAYGGDNVGAVSVLSPGAKLVSHGFSPEQMDLRTLHRVPEERISAVLRVPAIVAGLGAGLDRSTFANYSEANQSFIENTVLGLYRADDKKLTHSLSVDFVKDRKISIAHDITQMRALQDDEDKKATRLSVYVAAGILDVDEARAEIGLEPRPEQAAIPEPTPLRALPAAAGRSLRDGAVASKVAHLPDQFRSQHATVGLGQGRDGSDAVHVAPDCERCHVRQAGNRPVHDVVVLDDCQHGKSIARKALDDLPGRFDDLKGDAEPAWQAALEAFLAAQLGRINARLRAGDTTADVLVAEAEAHLLRDTLLPLQTAILSEVQGLVVAELGIAFDLDDAATRAYLRLAGGNIRGITNTTRKAVQAALIEGQANGEGIPQLARRLRDLPAFNQARAITVSRTELGHSQNTAALSTYKASGVVGAVTVFDGDYDAACQAMNGRTFPLDQAPATLQHPRCTRAFAPVLAQEASA